ncbi:uncharacterized protein LY89DRAFT_760488 [Mollisia scopiformis]|uniref:Alpha/beta hydrolase fold-3 domain-containing protein n=1 Tax=Mollisia scopiformis TaxID=149040 RepID=A0A132BFR4_MOLSC|nr:uncharacterized protein LY89DRAFT_760488 [Mollisia scopiformis]KUJ10557.1 hypothetical protein LY89DRAFT_760488 [Mollisia scopiformis]
MIHGGFCLGRAEQEDSNCRRWVWNHDEVAISIEDRLAPEVQFPVSVEDYWDALKWIATNSEMLNAHASKGFVLGSTSSNSTCALVLSHLARDEALSPPLTGLFLFLPTTCHPSTLPEPHALDIRIVSWEQCRDPPSSIE